MRILLICPYFNRPKLLVKAMQSVLRSHEYHSDWELVFGDDNSPIPGEPIVREILASHLDRVTFINSQMSLDDKLIKGLMVGYYANRIVLESKADVVVTLCDDDQLYPTYLRDISAYFYNNSAMWAYSHVVIFNPLCQDITNVTPSSCPYNAWTEPIDPAGKLDASQVAWRTQIVRDGIRFPETTRDDETKPWLMNPDMEFFRAVHARYGPAPFTGLVSQYKGIHDYQLLWHKKNGEEGLRRYVETLLLLGGELI